MVQIPRAGTTQGGLGFAPQANPEQVLALGQSIGRSLGGVVDTVLDARQQLQDAERKQVVAFGGAQVVKDLAALQDRVQADPDFTGSTERFEAGAKLIREGVTERFDRTTAAIINTEAARISASMQVSVSRTERAKFGANARNTMETLTDSYINATATAQNDVTEQQLTGAFQASVAQSDFLTPTEKTKLNERFSAGVSKTQAMRLLVDAPDALVSIIDDPASLPGLSPFERELFRDRGLTAAAGADAARDRSASLAIKNAQEDNLRDVLARFIAGESPLVIQADVVANPQEFSATGINTIRTALSGSAAKTDSPDVVVQLGNDVRAGEPGVLDDIDAAYVGGTITLGTRNGLISRHESRNEAPSTPINRAYDLVRGSFRPGFADAFTVRAQIEIQKSRALAELDAFLAGNPPEETILSGAESIVRAGLSLGAIQASAIVRRPHGISKNISDLTLQDIQESTDKIATALATGRMSDEEALLLNANNQELIPVIRAEEARKAKKAGGQ